MSNTFTAQELSGLYQKVADGGELEFRVSEDWLTGLVSPSLGSVRQDWRIKPTKKVIDLSVLINSQIDCEFDNGAVIAKLVSVKEDYEGIFYSSNHKKAQDYRDCRPRMNHKHAWQGGECPLPEGFVVRVWYRNGISSICSHVKEHNKATNLRWTFDSFETADIIAFEVLGLADGYLMPWEQDNEHSN